MDPRTFRNTLGHFATGVTVVTARDRGGRPVGVTVNAFASVSLDPPLVLICLADTTSDLEAYLNGGGFNVNILRDDQAEVSTLFATRDTDKFDRLAWHDGGNGLPALDGTLACLECVVDSTHRGGDHEIVVGRVLAQSYDQAGLPLLYFRGAYENLA